MVLLKELATRVRDAEREKAFAQVDARIAELMEAAGQTGAKLVPGDD
jgi:hypothetical protein